MRGILFKPDMIKAIAEGRKTVTRRLSGLEKVNQESSYITRVAQRDGIWRFYHSDAHILDYDRKPRYQAGETVYVKETWAPCGCVRPTCTGYLHKLAGEPARYIKWHSPMMMPERAARIFLVIKSARPERLHEITDEDAIKEGVGFGFTLNGGWPDYQHIVNGVCELTHDTASMSYATLWDSVSPKHPWANSDWVWRYEFEVRPVEGA